MNEKSPFREPTILTPLLLFLSAYCGIHSSTTKFTEYPIQYRGKSNVSHFPRDGLWKRFIWSLGEFSISEKVAYTLTIGMIVLNIGTFKDISLGTNLSYTLFTLGITGLIFMILGSYAKIQRRRAISPEFDPLSYQCRLVSALKEHGVSFKDVRWDRDDLEKVRRKDGGRGIRERFVVLGLELQGNGEGEGCDVLVLFYLNGNVVFSVFEDGNGNEGEKLGGVVLGA